MCLCEINLCLNGSKKIGKSVVCYQKLLHLLILKKSLKFIAMKKLKRSQRGTFYLIVCVFFDIDGNQHVNNAIYFNWLLDVLGYDFLTTHQPKKNSCEI